MYFSWQDGIKFDAIKCSIFKFSIIGQQGTAKGERVVVFQMMK
jgi:hypothetical protein